MSFGDLAMGVPDNVMNLALCFHKLLFIRLNAIIVDESRLL